VVRRSMATLLPSLAAYLIAQRGSGPPQASAVALGSVVTTQLAQTLDASWSNGAPSRSVVKAVAASGGLLASTLLVPSLRNILGLALPTSLGWGLIGTGAAAAIALSRAYGGIPSVQAPSIEEAFQDGPAERAWLPEGSMSGIRPEN
jgi:cation-transporting P-type ATPase I